jgi:hypothetical protein
MKTTDRIREFISYFEQLPKQTIKVLNTQLEQSITEYLNSLTVAEINQKARSLGATEELIASFPTVEPSLISPSEQIADPDLDALRAHIHATAIMDLYKLTHEFTLAITDKKIEESSIRVLVDKAVQQAADNPEEHLNKSLTSFIDLVCLPISTKFMNSIIPEVDRDVADMVNKMFQ